MPQLKVLVVDDEPGIRSGIARILNNFTVGFPFMEEDFSYETLEAESGEDALAILEKTPVDILLLDNKLPGVDGIELLEHIHQRNFDVYVMMITSYASLDLAVKATQRGAYNFLPKPFTPQELKAAIEAISKHLYLRRVTRQVNDETRKTRFQFLSVLSHELKAPINAVEGYLQMIKEKQAGNNIDNYTQIIERSIERLQGMRTLINDLLDLTRIESGTKLREIREFDLCETVRSVIETIEPSAQQRKIKIFTECPATCRVKADQEEMEIILNNLLSNAVKYNKEEGEVHVSLKKENASVIIKVQDTGIGMTEEEQSQLFRDFVRIKNAKTRHITGSGLGLSIVKKLVNEYDGEITVHSIPDKGSIFIVVLPVLIS